MELIEIIVTTLKIFALLSVIIITLSYFFFKLKKQTSPLRAVVRESIDIAAEQVQPEPAYQPAVNFSSEPVYQYQRAVPSERFKIVNNQSVQSAGSNFRQPAQRPAMRSAENRSFNAYSYYADSDAASTMHKIKFSGMHS